MAERDYPKLIFKDEEAMCRVFWGLVLQYQAIRVIPAFAIYHNSNNQRIGGNKGKISQARDKAKGVVSGVLDYTVTGIGYLEAKRWYADKDGKVKRTYLEPEQREFRDYALSKGMRFAEFLTPAEGIDILLEWLKDDTWQPLRPFLKEVEVEGAII